MLNDISLASRLESALREAGIAATERPHEGTPGVASPHRLATEWQGYWVSDGARHYYAKVLHDDQRELINIEQSAQASHCAAMAGVAPSLIFSDAKQGVLLFDALPRNEWRWARVNSLASPQSFERLLALKRRLHEGPKPAFIRTRYDDLCRLRTLCARDGVPLPDEAGWIDQCADLSWQAVQSCAVQSVLLQGDGLASNVMIGPQGRLQLLDFDYACVGDPWFDIATTLNEVFSFEDQWRRGITLWHGSCSETDYARCRLYALIDDWFWTLWAMWCGRTSSRALEFSKLGQWTLLRCRLSVQDKRFESWLRQSKEGC